MGGVAARATTVVEGAASGSTTRTHFKRWAGPVEALLPTAPLFSGTAPRGLRTGARLFKTAPRGAPHWKASAAQRARTARTAQHRAQAAVRVRTARVAHLHARPARREGTTPAGAAYPLMRVIHARRALIARALHHRVRVVRRARTTPAHPALRVCHARRARTTPARTAYPVLRVCPAPRARTALLARHPVRTPRPRAQRARTQTAPPRAWRAILRRRVWWRGCLRSRPANGT
jgi:hypothetical protein